MDGILVINKPSGITSRDVVNKLCKILGTKKIGHTGTLDPIASGVLVLCIGKATKLVEMLTCDDKDYIATVKTGVLTDTLDMDGKILKKQSIKVNEKDLLKTLNSFIGSYDQEVPAYSAVKINGKKLYEYARNKENVTLPKRKVKIKNIELLELSSNSYKFKVSVSKGTYIRSLIKDIDDKLGIIGSMSGLIRTRQGKFSIDNSYTIKDVQEGNYELFSIEDVLIDENCVIINDKLFKMIKNGRILNNEYKKDIITFVYDGKVVAIYKTYEKDTSKIKPYKVFV